MKKLLLVILLLLISIFIAACGGATEVVGVQDDQAVQETQEQTQLQTQEGGMTFATHLGQFEPLPSVLPRTETLFFGGLQWGTAIANSPFFLNANNGMVIETGAQGSRVPVFETLYMYNMMTGQLVPLLAYGEYQWNSDFSVLTVNLNADAHWSNGYAVTARDMVVTFDTHLWAGTGIGSEFGQFITHLDASDVHTLQIYLNMQNHNIPRAIEFLTRMYVLSADFIEYKLELHNHEIESFRADVWAEPVHSGPYRPMLLSPQQVVLQRDNLYWGAADSMWGRLPAPRFLAHNVYATNDAIMASFRAGQIDMSQAFTPNVWELWEEGLPISTFIPNPPFYLSGTMPAIWFNTTRPGLDQQVIRQAIALAIDYDQIISAAMSGYSPSFTQVPRSIASPAPAEQMFINHAALSDLQWGSQDIEGANALLDAAGIIDTTGNGIRELNGEELHFTLVCPMGWSDWEVSLEIVAAAGAAIGIGLSTNFVEAAVWTEMQQTGDFDIIMASPATTGAAAPWSRAFQALFVEDSDAERVFWGWHRLHNPEINELILAAASETNHERLAEYYTQISRFLLEYKPVIWLMYRPVWFYTVNESVWTNFPELGDGNYIPPLILLDAYGIAGLYNLTLVD